MSLISHKKIYYINFLNRVSGTDSNFNYIIPYYVEDDFDYVAVLQCTVPKTFYLVQANLNTFTLTEGTFNATITIPVGNYTRRAIQNTIQSLLNAASSGITYTVNWPGVNVADTGKFTFTCTNFGGIQPILTFNSVIAEVIGFDDNSVNQFSNFTLVSTNVINLQLNSILYLHSDICTNSGNDDILQEIFTAAGNATYANIHFENYDLEAYSKPLVSKAKTLYYFFLTDVEGNEINLNGINMDITLILYKKNDIDNWQRNFIKYQLHKQHEEDQNNFIS